MSKFFFPFGITVTVAVLVSLFVSFTLDPMLSSIWKDPPKNRLATLPVIGRLMRATDRCMERLHTVYERLIRWIFSGRRYGGGRLHLGPRGIVLAIGVGSFAGALGLAPLVGSEFIPQTDNSYVQLNVRLPVGIGLERAGSKIAQLEREVRAMPEVRLVSSTIGDSGNGSRNQAQIGIQLIPRLERKRTQKQVEDALRESLKAIPGIEVSVGERPIYVALLGPEPQVLEAEIAKLADKVAQIKGIVDLETSVKPGLPAYAVRLKHDAVRELGLTPTELAASLRAFVNGDVATYWTAPDGEQVEVELRLPRASRENIGQLEDLPVAYARDGTPIALGRVADIVPVLNPEIIKRQDLQRRQAIYAGVKDRPAGDVGKEVQKIVKEWQLPAGYRFDIGGQTKDQ